MATHFLLHYGPWEDMVSVILTLRNAINHQQKDLPDQSEPAPGDGPPASAGQQARLPAEDRGGGLHQNQAGSRLPLQKTRHLACTQVRLLVSSKSVNLIPTQRSGLGNPTDPSVIAEANSSLATLFPVSCNTHAIRYF